MIGRFIRELLLRIMRDMEPLAYKRFMDDVIVARRRHWGAYGK